MLNLTSAHASEPHLTISTSTAQRIALHSPRRSVGLQMRRICRDLYLSQGHHAHPDTVGFPRREVEIRLHVEMLARYKVTK
jgi:hypothetical protein